MSARCEAELCPYWTGQGCACDVMGIEPSPTFGLDDDVAMCRTCGATIYRTNLDGRWHHAPRPDDTHDPEPASAS